MTVCTMSDTEVVGGVGESHWSDLYNENRQEAGLHTNFTSDCRIVQCIRAESWLCHNFAADLLIGRSTSNSMTYSETQQHSMY